MTKVIFLTEEQRENVGSGFLNNKDSRLVGIKRDRTFAKPSESSAGLGLLS